MKNLQSEAQLEFYLEILNSDSECEDQNFEIYEGESPDFVEGVK